MGYTVFARYSGHSREEKVDLVELEEFPELASRVARALLTDRPISETLTRKDVLAADSEGVLRTIGVWQPETVKGAWIINSKDLEILAVTQGLAQEAEKDSGLELIGGTFSMEFDNKGDMPELANIMPK